MDEYLEMFQRKYFCQECGNQIDWDLIERAAYNGEGFDHITEFINGDEGNDPIFFDPSPSAEPRDVTITIKCPECEEDTEVTLEVTPQDGEWDDDSDSESWRQPSFNGWMSFSIDRPFDPFHVQIGEDLVVDQNRYQIKLRMVVKTRMNG